MKPELNGSDAGRRMPGRATNPIPAPLDAEPHCTGAHSVPIEDIAHALANSCILAGQTKVFFSVAQHNYLASMFVPPEDALAALLFRTEAALEHLLHESLELAAHDVANILARLGQPALVSSAVEYVDLVLRATEQYEFGPLRSYASADITDVIPLPLKIQPLPAIVAKHLFLDRYYELRAEAEAEGFRRTQAARRDTK